MMEGIKDVQDENIWLSKLALREYQIEMIETSKKQNSIVFLPTGSGKTLIALQVLRSRMKYLTGSKGELRKIAVVLATTKLLLYQWNGIITENTILKTKLFSGEMGIDDWTVETWRDEIGDAEVLILVPSVFLTIIQRQILRTDKISLIVFDECHHAVSGHPYRRIMQEIDKLSEDTKPLLLGLTPCVLNSNPVKDGFEEVKALKSTFNGIFAQTHLLEEAMKYGTSPNVRFIFHNSEAKSKAVLSILNLLNTTVPRFRLVKPGGEVDKAAQNIVPKGGILLHRENIFMKHIVNIFRHIEKAIKDLGLYPASFVALFYYIRLERLKMTRVNPVEIIVIQYAETILSSIRRLISRYIPMDEKDKIRKFSSQKVNLLIKLVEEYKDRKSIRCIIITEEKITATVLSAIFNELSLKENKFFKANFVTGGLVNSVIDSEEAKYEQKRLKAIIKSFSNEEFHFLFATNVIEEGVNVPSCNLVIKFDSARDYRSYIQSKGRARFQESEYVIFSKIEENGKIKKNVEKYNKTQKGLLKVLHSAEGTVPMEDEEEQVSGDEEYFFVKGPGGPCISGTQSISFIIRYCALLVRDKYSSPLPVCWYDAAKKRAYLRLPSLGPLKETIEGDPRNNRKLAKKNVFLKTVKELYKLGEILDDFTLRSRRCREEEHEELFHNLLRLEPEKRNKVECNTKTIYEIECAENLRDCLPQPHLESYIHVIKLTPQFSRPEDSRIGTFYDIICDPNGFAILSSKRLPKICDFPLFLSMGEFHCSLIVNAANVVLNETDIQKLKKFHFFIFETLLNVVNRLHTINNSGGRNSFFIIPISYVEGKLNINWSAINDFDRLSERCELNEVIIARPILNDFLNGVVTPKYRQTSLTKRYYIVTAIDHNQTPESKFPSEDYKNYLDYFMQKYKVRIMNKEQPLIEVKCLPERINYLKPRKSSSRKQKIKIQEDKENYKEHLVPELCDLISFPSSLWLKSTLLPSALHRITTICHIDEMRKKIASETKLGNSDLGCNLSWLPMQIQKCFIDEVETTPRFDLTKISQLPATSENENPELQPPLDPYRHMEEYAPCDMIHYVKYFGLIPNEVNSAQLYPKVESENFISSLSAVEVPDLPISYENQNVLKGPELRDFVKVFTCRSANDIVDLETLEFLGDSFLKFSAALYVFRNCNDNEGVLVSMKDQIVCNQNLYSCGIVKGFQGVLLESEFDARSGWNAPLFDLPREIKNLVQEDRFKAEYFFEIPLNDKLSGTLSPKTIKTIHDFTAMDEMRSTYMPDEATLGRKTIKDKCIADCVEALLGLYVKECGLVGGFKILNWLNILPEESGSFNALITKKFSNKEGNLMKIMEVLTEYCYEELEKTLGYQFQDKSLLLQALIHPSFPGNIDVHYQRLEFLGDAVIDFIVSFYIHHHCPDLPPGDATDLRISIVNNVTMACLAIKYDIHKFLMYSSPALLGAISQFATFQQERNHKVDDAILIVTEEGEKNVAEAIEVPKALGDLFESLAGAIFLDSGNCIKTVWKSFYPLMKDCLELFMKCTPKSPLRKLYEYCNPPPIFTYDVLNNGYIKATCKIVYNGKEKTFLGKAASMHYSKLSAAKMAVRFLEGSVVEV